MTRPNGHAAGPELCPACFVAADDRRRRCKACGFDRNAAPRESDGTLPLGTRLRDRYVIGRILGHGGFGITYLGWDSRLRRRRAIKEYFPTHVATRDPSDRQVVPQAGETRLYNLGLHKYLEEARLLAQFEHHPCIVSPLDFFEENATAYLVMEYLEGETLGSYVRNQGGRIPYAHALHYLTPVLEALATVHRAGILHRDVSPENVFLTVSGDAKLIDFGAARQRLVGESAALTVILREHFAPPEQYTATGRQGAWTDVYALAATLYFAITGKAPPAAPERWLGDRLKRPRELGVSLPRGAEDALMRALALRIEDRPQRIDDLLTGLQSPEDDAERPDRLAQVRRMVARVSHAVRSGLPLRGRPRVAAWALAALGVVGVLWISANAWRPAAESPVSASSEARPEPASLDAPIIVAEPSQAAPVEGVETGQGETQLPEPAPADEGREGDAGSLAAADDAPGPLAEGGDASGEAEAAAAGSEVPSLELVVRSPYRGDRLFIDGQAAGSTGSTVHRLAPGLHQIRVTKDGYLPFEREVELVPGADRLVLRASLEPDPAALSSRFADLRRQLDAGQRRGALEGMDELARLGHGPAVLEVVRQRVYAGAPGERQEAIRTVRAAARRGLPDALYLLGLYLENGDWPAEAAGLLAPASPVRPAEGVLLGLGRWFTSSRDAFVRRLENHSTAGAPDELEEAARAYLEAARQGHRLAQERVGYMYASGRGVARNEREAFYWFLKAAQAGAVEAQYTVGMCYLTGRGYRANPEAAECWLARAASAGHADARSELESLESRYRGGKAPESCTYPPLGRATPDRSS